MKTGDLVRLYGNGKLGVMLSLTKFMNEKSNIHFAPGQIGLIVEVGYVSKTQLCKILVPDGIGWAFPIWLDKVSIK